MSKIVQGGKGRGMNKPGWYMLEFQWEGEWQHYYRVGKKAITDVLAILRDDSRLGEWCLFGTNGKIIESGNDYFPF